MAPTTVSLIAVIVSAASVLVSASTTVWATRQARRVQREARVQQRIGDAYLQVLEFAEGEGLYFSASHYNWELTTWDEWHVQIRRREARPETQQRVKTSALIAAFATDAVAQAYRTWLASTEIAEQAEDVLKWNTGENYAPDKLLAKKS